MHYGKMVTVRATVDGRPRLKKIGLYEDVDLEEAKAFARSISAQYGTRSVLRAESLMGNDAYHLAAYEGGRPTEE